MIKNRTIFAPSDAYFRRPSPIFHSLNYPKTAAIFLNRFDQLWYFLLKFILCAVARPPSISCTMGAKRVDILFQKKRYLYLSEAEYSILLKSLVRLKNKLIQQNRFTDCVDELLIKLVSAPIIKI